MVEIVAGLFTKAIGVESDLTKSNIVPGPRSRRRPQKGDVFAIEFDGGGWVYGRVVLTDAIWTAVAANDVDPANLIYLFDYVTEGMRIPNRSELSAANLMFPPILINNLPWTRGHFQFVENLDFQAGEALDSHCFKAIFGSIHYYDDSGRRSSAPVEPVGDYGLASYAVVDEMVSEKLGLPMEDH